MNNSLKGEALKHFDNGETQEEIVDAILALIESKMPEKKEYTKSTHSTVRSQLEIMKKQYTELGYNEAIDEVQSILRGSDENNNRQ